ncbi:hypothetical protein KAU33_12585 [Candidatus Dependentiae bacterium]|nr:hypothetical protein [Candidatus Dependentiae bacterium]
MALLRLIFLVITSIATGIGLGMVIRPAVKKKFTDFLSMLFAFLFLAGFYIFSVALTNFEWYAMIISALILLIYTITGYRIWDFEKGTLKEIMTGKKKCYRCKTSRLNGSELTITIMDGFIYPWQLWNYGLFWTLTGVTLIISLITNLVFNKPGQEFISLIFPVILWIINIAFYFIGFAKYQSRKRKFLYNVLDKRLIDLETTKSFMVTEMILDKLDKTKQEKSIEIELEKIKPAESKEVEHAKKKIIDSLKKQSKIWYSISVKEKGTDNKIILVQVPHKRNIIKYLNKLYERTLLPIKDEIDGEFSREAINENGDVH